MMTPDCAVLGEKTDHVYQPIPAEYQKIDMATWKD